MNLEETVKCLEHKHIEVALYLGEHIHCDLNSNCPLAIQLRRIISDAGVTLTDLLDGYAQVTAPEPIAVVTPQVTGEIQLNVVGKEFTIDLYDVLAGQVKVAYETKLAEFRKENKRIKEIGRSLYNTYLLEIANLRSNHVLPQFKATPAELARYKVMITELNGNYAFLFPVEYHPEYIVQDSIRYQLKEEDIASIKRSAYLEIIVSTARKVLNLVLLDATGEKFSHYHGRGNDCWGQVKLQLEGNIISLKALDRVKTIAMNSLVTINFNSLMQDKPPGMPDIRDLLLRSKKLGKEGDLQHEPDAVESAVPGWTTGTEAHRGWGRRE